MRRVDMSVVEAAPSVDDDSDGVRDEERGISGGRSRRRRGRGRGNEPCARFRARFELRYRQGTDTRDVLINAFKLSLGPFRDYNGHLAGSGPLFVALAYKTGLL